SLAAGLNLSGVNTRKLARSTLGKPKDDQTEAVQSHRAVGTAIQMNPAVVVCVLAQEEQTRLALEKWQAEEEVRECVIARRNTELDVQSLEHSESINTKLS
ncbi:hypothetical protein ARMGADRAFT_1019688, partial [Armillaria gallica]